jgi:hypothetical protein
MRRVSRGVSVMVFSACAACNSDYWLGGQRHDLSGGDAGVFGEGGTQVPGRILTADIVLRGGDSLDISPGASGPCRLVGNGFGIRSVGVWTGKLSIRNCEVEGLGSATSDAISVTVSEGGSVTIDGVTFGSSGAIHIGNDGDSTTTFRDNVIDVDSTVPLDPSADDTTPAFSADGSSTAQKLFQGNKIFRSSASFQSPNWLIGGSSDAESNIIVGLRAGIILAASGLVVRGNYVHSMHFSVSGDESAVSTSYTTFDVLAEHNVFRGGTWVFRSFGGELRYNAVLDSESSALLYQPFENTKVHHNLFLMCNPPRNDLQAAIFLVNARAAGIEVYNNTLDGGGPTMKATGGAVAIDERCFLSSLRSNLIFHFPYWRNDGGAAAVRPGILEGVNPPPQRLGYADYNLFYNDPPESSPRNYAVAVGGRTLRADPGFGAHDAHAGGPVDEQVDPGALGIAGGCFPWSDADIKGSKVTVSQMLAALRAGYTPAPGSALLFAGDPADGTGNYIGAVGSGSAADDLFGTFGR